MRGLEDYINPKRRDSQDWAHLVTPYDSVEHPQKMQKIGVNPGCELDDITYIHFIFSGLVHLSYNSMNHQPSIINCISNVLGKL